MIISIKELLFLVSLFAFLILLGTNIFGINFFKPIKNYYSSYGRKLQVNHYISEISKRPEDTQKMIFREALIMVIFSFLIFVFASKVIFFTAVVSDSMRPTFERNDLVLIENIDHSYRPGDIIMFIEPFTLRPTTHRIVSIERDVIRTAGDFSGVMDGWKISRKDILGKAVIINGGPVVIKDYGKFFIVSDKKQDLALFGNDYRSYFLFFQVIKIYGYVIVVICVTLYIALTMRKKTWQNR